MKARRFLRALPLALLLISAARAEQGTIIGPIVGPKTMTEVMTVLNAAHLAIQSCNSGSAAPANGVSAAPTINQCWADTSANPTVYKRYDGTSWVSFGKLNTSTHIWTPVYQGTDLSTASVATTGTSGHTLGFLDGANTWSATQSINSGNLALKGSTSGAGTLNAPAVASSYVWTLPALTDTLVGKATVDSLTNKTFDTAATGNSFSINGLAATANTGTGAVVRATSPTLATPTIGVATATSINKNIFTAPATSATLTLIDGTTLTGPAASGTAMTLGNAETVTGAKSFNDATVMLKGATSGTTTVKAAAVAGTTTLSLPAVTDTLVGKATTDVLTNKTLDTAGAGNSLAINGLAATANTGTGAVVRAISPAITTPTGIVRGDVGLGNVDNTSDTTKWASTKTLTNTTFDTAGTGNSFSINGVAALANTGTGAVARAGSPTFTGTPAAPTATNGTNTTQLATTQFVQSAVAASTSGVSSFNGLTGIVTTNIVVQKFTVSGTYTPTSGMLHAIIECIGGGGGGGGAPSAGAGFTFSGGGGGGGSYSRSVVTAAIIGASKAVTVGSAGSAGAAGSNVGGAGGDSSVAAICVGKGGSGGPLDTSRAGGAGGVAGTGDVITVGPAGGPSMNLGGTIAFGANNGASTTSGQGGLGFFSSAGGAASGYGSGGAGGNSFNGGASAAGGAGAPGIVIITEYVNL